MSFIKESYLAYKKVQEVLEKETSDHEIAMARSELEGIADKATATSSMLEGMTESGNPLPAWVQSKITNASDYITSVHDYLKYNPQINEAIDLSKRNIGGGLISQAKAIARKFADNYTKAYNEIEKLQKGLTQNTEVQRALMQYNEEVKLDEIKISDIHKMQQDGKSSEDIAKELNLNPMFVKKILGEQVELKEFNDAQIALLKKEFDPLKNKQISTARANQLSNILDKLDDGTLQKLRDALIPFVSAVSAAKLTTRKFKGFKITNVKVPGLEGMAEESSYWWHDGKSGYVKASDSDKDLVAWLKKNGYKPEKKEMTEENEYVAVHVKKGKTSVTANSSYEAAKKASEKFGLKNTIGITVMLAKKDGEDVIHKATEEVELQEKPSRKKHVVFKIGDKLVAKDFRGYNDDEIAKSIDDFLKQNNKSIVVQQSPIQSVKEEKIPSDYFDYLRTIVYKKVDFYEIPPKQIIQHWKDEPHKDRFKGKLIDYKEAVDLSKATKLKMISIKGDQKEITIDKKDLEKYLKLDYVIKEYLPEDTANPGDAVVNMAKRLGLDNYGYARYGKDNVVTHRQVGGMLQKIDKPFKLDKPIKKEEVELQESTDINFKPAISINDLKKYGTFSGEYFILTGTKQKMFVYKTGDKITTLKITAGNRTDEKDADKSDMLLKKIAKDMKYKKIDAGDADYHFTKEEVELKPVPSLEDSAKKHNVDIETLKKQLEKGIQVEKEHTKDEKVAEKIALAHIDERPDYYVQIDKLEKKPVEKVTEVKEPTGELKDACWKGYVAVGFKMKNGKRVPNCVPKSEAYKGAKAIVENAFKKLKEKK